MSGLPNHSRRRTRPPTLHGAVVSGFGTEFPIGVPVMSTAARDRAMLGAILGTAYLEALADPGTIVSRMFSILVKSFDMRAESLNKFWKAAADMSLPDSVHPKVLREFALRMVIALREYNPECASGNLWSVLQFSRALAQEADNNGKEDEVDKYIREESGFPTAEQEN